MRFTHDIEIAKDRAEVWKAFVNPDNMKAWQPTLQSRQQVSGVPGVEGAVARLTYLEDGRTIEMTETLTRCVPPSEMEGTYDAGHAKNTMRLRFEEAGPGRTLLRCEAEFEFRGAFKLMAPLISGMIQKRTGEDLGRFRDRVEAGEI